MILGLLADSHGRQRTTAAAVAALLERGATKLIHLGDYETVEVIDELVGHRACGVLGNCDYPQEKMVRYARSVGVTIEPIRMALEFDGKRIVATHGHIERAMTAALRDKVDYLFHGHSHELRDERVGSTRIINPGALARANLYTAAVLDTEADRLDVIEIPRGLD